MPYPIGHSFVGAAIAKKTDIPLWFALILTNLPDIDFLLGIFKGNLLIFHGNDAAPLAHTPWLAVIVVTLFLLVTKLRNIRFSKRSVIGVFLLVIAHILLDFHPFPLPYRIDTMGGTNGLSDFLFTFIINPDFLWNNLVDLAFYGSLYIIVIKLIFREKKLL